MKIRPFVKVTLFSLFIKELNADNKRLRLQLSSKSKIIEQNEHEQLKSNRKLQDKIKELETEISNLRRKCENNSIEYSDKQLEKLKKQVSFFLLHISACIISDTPCSKING